MARGGLCACEGPVIAGNKVRVLLQERGLWVLWHFSTLMPGSWPLLSPRGLGMTRVHTYMHMCVWACEQHADQMCKRDMAHSLRAPLC